MAIVKSCIGVVLPSNAPIDIRTTAAATSASITRVSDMLKWLKVEQKHIEVVLSKLNYICFFQLTELDHLRLEICL